MPSARDEFFAGVRGQMPLLIGVVPFGLIYGALAAQLKVPAPIDGRRTFSGTIAAACAKTEWNVARAPLTLLPVIFMREPASASGGGARVLPCSFIGAWACCHTICHTIQHSG